MGNDAATDIHGELSDKELSGRGEWRGIVDSIPWTIGDRTTRRCSSAAARRREAKLQTPGTFGFDFLSLFHPGLKLKIVASSTAVVMMARVHISGPCA